MSTARTLDLTALKAALREQWDRSAARWDEHAPQIRAWLATATRAMLDMAAIGPRDPFQAGSLLSISKPGLADPLFRAAGLRDVATTTLDAPFHLPTARYHLDFVRTSASPIQ